MADKHDAAAALDETEAIGPEEITQADEEWPVAREYRVPDDGDGGIPVSADEAGELVVPAPPRSRLPLYIGSAVLAALLALVLLLGAAWLVWRGDDGTGTQAQQTLPASPPAKPKKKNTTPSSVAVPDVTGLDVTRARSLLQDAGLRVETRTATSASDTASPGEVLRQTPGAGTDAKAGSAVLLTVSDVQSRIQVPTVVGLRASEANRTLRDAGLRAEIRLVRSQKPAGTVIGQTPSAGSDVGEDTTVRLEVAKAAPPVTIAVPRLLGSTAPEAKSRLRDLGLRWTTDTVESAKPEGTVVGQSPGAGARLRKGEAVSLEVSGGPAQVTIPDVTGLDEQSARAQLEAAGFSVQVSSEVTTDPSQDGMVVGQTPAGGSKSESGGTVTLTVARLG